MAYRACLKLQEMGISVQDIFTILTDCVGIENVHWKNAGYIFSPDFMYVHLANEHVLTKFLMTFDADCLAQFAANQTPNGLIGKYMCIDWETGDRV